MITVDEVIEKTKNASGVVNEQNEEMLRTGQVKAAKQSYLPWVLLGIGALAVGIWLFKKGKQENAPLSG